MNLLDTYKSKGECNNVLERFINIIKIRFGHTIKFIKTDNKQSLGGRYQDFLATTRITSERTTPYSPQQNGSAERSGGVLMMKARCIHALTGLPATLWPEVFRVIAYLLNRTPTRLLGWKTPWEANAGKKLNLAHLHVYGYKAYPLKPPASIPRKQRLEPRAHIGFLVGYDSTNIYRIWIPSQQKVIRTKDVTFDESKFYDPSEFDAAHRYNVSELVEVIEFAHEAPSYRPQEADNDNWEFLEEQLLRAAYEIPTDRGNELLKETVESTSDSQGLPTLNSEDYQHLPTPSPTPSYTRGSPQPRAETEEQTEHRNELRAESTYRGRNFATLQLGDYQPQELLSGIQGPRRPSPQHDTSARSRRSEQSAARVVGVEFSETNILPEGSKRARKPRKEAFAASLAPADPNGTFHTAFAAALVDKSTRPHRDDLPPPPKSWKHAMRHPLAKNWLAAANIEMKTCQKQDTFRKVLKQTARGKQSLGLIWVFAYKFDTDGYLLKLKARLCVRGDQQSTEQKTYVTTLTVKTF